MPALVVCWLPQTSFHRDLNSKGSGKATSNACFHALHCGISGLLLQCVGLTVGAVVGLRVGLRVGETVGLDVGPAVEGLMLGLSVGEVVGPSVGEVVGPNVLQMPQVTGQ